MVGRGRGTLLRPDLVATVARLEASNSELPRVIHQPEIDKRNLVTENLSLLHRTRLAEDRMRPATAR